MVYVGRKNGMAVKDVVVYQLDKQGEVKLSVRAQSGEVEADAENQKLIVKLYDGTAEQPSKDPHSASNVTRTPFKCLQIPLDYGKVLKSEKPALKKRGQMRMAELIDRIRHMDRDFPMLSQADRLIQKTMLIVEANRRVSIAVGCFSFMLIGIPLGVKSHRKETSIGMVLSLVIVFAYYLFIVIAKALASHPELHPNLILWFPLIFAQFLGFWLIKRAS
jgi:lipopolysaccharide export system permease protein